MTDNLPPAPAPEPGSTPEYLDSHEGQPLDTPPAPRRTRRNIVIGGALVGALAVGGVAAWAVTSFLRGGPDAAEALPGDTIGFVSVNLDPSGEQKIAALETLKKFPGLKDKLDLGTADDVRQKIFEAVQKSGDCQGVDYAKDIQPWLGNTLAVAAVDTGESHPSPVVVFQVSDQDKAKAGFDKMDAECKAGSGSSTPTGVAFEDGWAVVAQKQETADKVVADAKGGTLADDASYKKWIAEAGDSGIVSMYAAPKAGSVVLDEIQSKLAASPFGGPKEIPQATKDQLAGFKGGAGVVRFHNGALEFEFAADFNPASTGLDWSASGAGDLVGTLPADTAFAAGMSLPHGFVDFMLNAMAPSLAPGMTADQLKAQLQQQTGLTPDDIEALTGDSLAVAVSSHLDLEKVANSGDPSSLEVGVKVKGDAAKANAALDKIRAQMGPAASFLASKDKDGYFAVGPNSSYLDSLLRHGGLGDDKTFQDVVPHPGNSTSVLYLNFDAGDNWLVTALKDAGAPAEVIDNVEPLSALGMSGWLDGDVSHGLVKITTD